MARTDVTIPPALDGTELSDGVVRFFLVLCFASPLIIFGLGLLVGLLVA